MWKRQTEKIHRLYIAIRLQMGINQLDKQLFNQGYKRYSVKFLRFLNFSAEIVTVGWLNNNIKFEVREIEPNHNEAHFHITIRGKGSGTYRISDLSPIKSNLRRLDEKIVLQWAHEHRGILVDTWNQFHGYRVVVS